MIIDRIDECARALQIHGVPCRGYQMWVVGDRVHYWFDTAGTLSPEQDATFARIMAQYITGDSE